MIDAWDDESPTGVLLEKLESNQLELERAFAKSSAPPPPSSAPVVPDLGPGTSRR